MHTPLPRASVTFRPCSPGDAPFLRYLYGTTREDEMLRVPWSDQQKAEFLDMQFRAQASHYADYYPDAAFLMIEMEGHSIGRLYVDRRDDVIEIIDIALLPQYRGRGLGRLLLQEILDEAQESGKRVTIYVENYNPARHLYDRLGFRHIDTNGVYHLMEWRAG
ncbi:MAG: GNAT family N-acetyltransferase [Thermoanaerobaculia bacterium]